MKATIEKSVIFMEDDERNHNMLTEFNYIIQAITTANSLESLKMNMKTSCGKRYFDYGFGGSHMYVHQKDVSSDLSNVDESERIIIVNL
jgi:hypothetical protein